MDCRGIVTKIDDFFCYTIIDDVKKVHWSIFLVRYPGAQLPAIGTGIALDNLHQYGHTYVVCNLSLLEGQFNRSITENRFINFVSKYHLGAADLILIDKVIKLFECNFTEIRSNSREEVILAILERLLVLDDKLKETSFHQCLNKIIYFNIVSVSSCRYVELQSDKYSSFPDWSFGVYSGAQQNNLLFGLLDVHPTYGFLMLKDSHRSVPTIITRNSQYETYFIAVGSYVLIKNYKMFTEIFRESNVPCLEYFLIEAENISVIVPSFCNINNTEVELCELMTRTSCKPAESISFDLIMKSMTRINDRERSILYLQISLYRKNDMELQIPETIFLIMSSTFIKSLNLVEAGKYRLMFHTPLKLTINTELSRYGLYKIYEVTDPEAYIEKLSCSSLKIEKLLTVEQSKKYVLENNTNIFSFQGVLKFKRLCSTNVRSKTKRNSKMYGFGTPGSRVHQLVFSYNENNKEVYLDCYINDWENSLMPLGLIPQVRVAVKYVLPQSRKYVKCTAFTKFEVLSYEPQIDFQTVNLFHNDDIDWGPQFSLGAGSKIPCGVTVWGKVFSVCVHTVSLSHVCRTCNSKCEVAIPCSKCNDTEKDVDFTLKLEVKDETGQSKIIVKNPEILKFIINVHDSRAFKKWLEDFKASGNYNFDMFKQAQGHSDETAVEVIHPLLTCLLKSFNTSNNLCLHIKCLKLNSGLEKEKVVYKYIDAREN